MQWLSILAMSGIGSVMDSVFEQGFQESVSAKSGVRSGVLCMLIEYIGKGDDLVVIPFTHIAVSH